MFWCIVLCFFTQLSGLVDRYTGPLWLIQIENFSAKHVRHVNYGMQYISHESDEILMKKHVGRLIKLLFIPQVLLERRPL